MTGSASAEPVKDQNARVSFGIFKSEEGYCIDDAVAHMVKVAALIEKNSNINVAILKCLDNSWAAVFIVWKGGGSQNAEESALNLPEAAVFTKGLKCAVRTVDSGWFQPSSQQTSQGIPFAQLSPGDIVSIRRIYCSWKRQDMLSYSCLAILRSYFNCLKGIISYSFYDSLNGKQIIGLAIWDSIESASALIKYPHTSLALPYWKELGVKELKYHKDQRFLLPVKEQNIKMTGSGSAEAGNGQNARASFGIFRPEEGCCIDDAVAHMVKVALLLENNRNINVAILKCLDNSWAAVFIVWKGGGSQNAEEWALNLPEAAVFTKGLKCAVRTVDSGWFQPSSQQTRQGVPFAQLSLGDIVSIRRIYCSWKRQNMLSYSCLAILRSYFNCFKGLISYSFYDSLNGKQIIGLAIWDSKESASALIKYPHTSPALPYWKEVGVKDLKYHVCQVVYATPTTSNQNSRPGFRI
ncbi:hypothetical protein KI387_023040 [Taxus chinensis]|uniref:DUF7392 domain-containing protein n=1 Tax=Taxus chinensis TaxID=29808 RepID=A0AA38G382_TAXCH|nr:hypothetical protein KI387_023040 [Taxus chinensis]